MPANKPLILTRLNVVCSVYGAAQAAALLSENYIFIYDIFFYMYLFLTQLFSYVLSHKLDASQSAYTPDIQSLVTVMMYFAREFKSN